MEDTTLEDAPDPLDVADAPTRGDGRTGCAGSMTCRPGLVCQAFLGTSQCRPCGGPFQSCGDGGCTTGACRFNFCANL